jgi:pimeloyl-ACP methyl ester carboxylesterase
MQRSVGGGVRGAAILWSDGDGPSDDNVVVFLHGVQAFPPYFFGAWLKHLAVEGNTIIYPAYRDPRTKPQSFRRNLLSGVRAALQTINAHPTTLVVIGYSIGGALAFDYSAVAASRSLPSAGGVLAVYPAWNPPEGKIPFADLSRIAPQTRLEVIAGPGDPFPRADAMARALLDSANRVPRWRRTLYSPPALSPIGFASQANRNPAASDRLWVAADRVIRLSREGQDLRG